MRAKDIAQHHFPLTGAGIDEAGAHIGALLEGIAERRDILRIRLATEEIFNVWQRTPEGQNRCCVQYVTGPGRKILRLSAPGPSVNPNTDSGESELEETGNLLLDGLGLTHPYRYKNGVNQVDITVPGKHVNPLILVVLAAVLAVVLGMLTTRLPAPMQTLLTQQLATPLLNVLLGLLTGVAMPMIFFSVCTGILGIGTVAALGRIGKKFLLRILGWTLAVAALTVAGVCWLFPIASGGAQAGEGMASIFSLVLLMIPTNLFSPFLEGNALQLILIGVAVGGALLMLGNRADSLSRAVWQADALIALFMGGITRLLPLFVFLAFFGLTATADIAKLEGAAEIMILTAVACLVLTLGLTIAACLRCRVSMGTLLRKVIPSFLLSLTTASSAASFPLRLEICEKRLGVAHEAARFTVSLGQTLFKPAGCLFYPVCALCVAGIYAVPITPLWLVLCTLVSAVLTVATPPVAGGTKMAYAALFLQLGIPAEGLLLVLAAEPILDFLLTAVNTHSQMMLLLMTVKDLNLLNRDVLIARD